MKFAAPNSKLAGLFSGRVRRREATASTGFASSTFAELAWQRTRRASARWGTWGAVLGLLVGVALFAPASWLASAINSQTGDRLMLADARGTVWNGHAQLLLTGGAGSRDATALPGRLQWSLRPAWGGFGLTLQHACCLNGPLAMRVEPGFGRATLRLLPRTDGIGQWPAAWLGGLGTPFNTLQPGGTLRLASSGLTVELVQGRVRLTGSAQLDIDNFSSRLSPLDSLGRYRFTVRGDAAAGDAATLQLDTVDGALRLSGNGQWTGSRMRFRGEARAAEGQEAPLQNLLNIIGRRQGAVSLITIG